MSDAAGIPKDVSQGVPILTATGRKELLIENYRGILEYRMDLIRIQTKGGQIRVSGESLCIEYYTNDEMKIIGMIAEIQYIH